MTEGVYPPIFKIYEKYGLYVLKLYKNFSWRYVIIDDRIPWYKSTKTPIYGCWKDLSELWVPLIEKAYAKLHQCYQSLNLGYIDDGLSDFTGLITEKVNVIGPKGKLKIFFTFSRRIHLKYYCINYLILLKLIYILFLILLQVNWTVFVENKIIQNATTIETLFLQKKLEWL